MTVSKQISKVQLQYASGCISSFFQYFETLIEKLLANTQKRSMQH